MAGRRTHGAPPRRCGLTLVIAVVAVAAAGCGRKATERDCQQIVDRVIEAELRALKLTDPAVVEKKKQELLPGFKDEMKECVGRRITEGMMECVRHSQTSEEIYGCIR